MTTAPSPTERPASANVTCADGVVLPVRLRYPPAGTAPLAVVQFNPGTAVPIRFYRRFLDYLAAGGFVVAAYDNRGTGASRPAGDLRDCRYRYLDYGTLDAVAVLDHLREAFAGLPLLIVGHSAGGQQLPLYPAEAYRGVRGALLFAVSTGYGAGLADYYRPRAWAFWHLIGPALTRVYGYPRLSRLGLMEDLPTGVYRDWRRWCTSPDYFFDARFQRGGAEAHETVNSLGAPVPTPVWEAMEFPVRHVHAPTDEISSLRNVGTFWRHWRPAGGVEQVVLDPADYGGRPIRHFDYFREGFAGTVWAAAAAWLRARVAHPPGTGAPKSRRV